ncbi:MAG: hypothetical protein QF907_01590 [Nitrospinota bacterium]|jgi:hypothetical protein|nr:hypothetical protein [Nitrospinota bacterium]
MHNRYKTKILKIDIKECECIAKDELGVKFRVCQGRSKNVPLGGVKVYHL